MIIEIKNSRDEVVFSADSTSKTYTFSNETLKTEMQRGILVPSYSQSAQVKRVYLPQSSSSEEVFTLFQKAVCYFFDEQLKQDGFTLTVR